MKKRTQSSSKSDSRKACGRRGSLKKDPVAAIQEMIDAKGKIKELNGVLYRKGFGSIDIIWGKVGPFHNGEGMAHILDKHRREIEGTGISVSEFVVDILLHGAIFDVNDLGRDDIGKGERYVFTTQNGCAFVSVKRFGRKKNCVRTSYTKSFLPNKK